MVGGGDPGGTDLGFDLGGGEVCGDHGLEGGDVDGVTVGVGLGCFLGLAELGADVAGEVLGGGDETLGGGVVVDQGAELFAGLVRGEAAEAGNLVEVDSAVGVDRKSTRLNSSHVASSYA